MAILAVIPARLGATRLPRKPLRELGGRPLVVRVWERVTRLGVADACVIATDSQDVASIAREAGATAVITSSAHPSGTDRIAEVAALPKYAGYATLLNIQGDEPFVSEEALRSAAALVTQDRFPLGTVAVQADAGILESPDVVKVVCTDDGRALYFSRAPIPFLRDGADIETRAAFVRQHIGVYAYSRDALFRWVALPPHPLERIERLEQLRPLAAGLAMGVATIAGPAEPGIDTEADLERANVMWDTLSAGRT